MTEQRKNPSGGGRNGATESFWMGDFNAHDNKPSSTQQALESARVPRHIKSVTFKAWFNGEAKLLKVTGKKARTLSALASSGNAGITALQLSNTWALRLGAYIHSLRHDEGLDIITQRQQHDDCGGWHGRYVLITPVEILKTE